MESPSLKPTILGKRVPKIGTRLVVRACSVLLFGGILGCVNLPHKAEPGTASAEAVAVSPSPTTMSSVPGPTRIAPAVSYEHFLRGYLEELAGQDDAAADEYAAALSDDPDSVSLRYRLAVLSFKEGRLQEGVDYAEGALRYNPDHIPTLILLGQRYAGLALNKPDRAIVLLERVVALQPDKLDSRLDLGVIYARVGRYADAERVIRQAMKVDPHSAMAVFYLGRVHLAQKKWKEATLDFEKTIELAPFFEQAYITLGELQLQQGHRTEAINTYKRLLKQVNPHDRDAMGRLVQLYVEEKTFDDALALLDDILRDDPQNQDARLLKGRLYMEMGKPTEAIAEFERVVAARPDDSTALYFLGRLYDDQGQTEKAIVQFERLVPLETGEIEAHLQLGVLYTRVQRFDDAIAVLKEAKSLAPDRPEVYLAEGFVWAQQDKYEKAAQVYKEGIAQVPTYPQLHFNLGMAYDKLEQFDACVKEMEEAIRLDPNFAEALNYLGYAYADRNIRLTEAIGLIKRAVAIKPNDGAYVDSLGWVHYRLGSWNEAVTELEKATRLLNDAVVYEHLGEAYLMAKRSTDAREAWLKSLELDPTNTKLIERFKAEGLGDPEAEDRFKRAKEKKEAQKPAVVNQNQSEKNIDSGT